MIDLIVFWFVIVIIHELGHILGYYIFNIHPTIEMKWYGKVEIGKKEMNKLKLSEFGFIAWFGIFTGALVIFVSPYSNDNLLWFVYILSCWFDINNIIEIITLPKEILNKKVPQVRMYQARQVIKQRGIV